MNAHSRPHQAFSDAFLNEIRARTPLATLVGRDVPLTRAAGGFKACCPFHLERNPSFFVYPDHYHCFGCGAHGDAVAYVMHRRRVSFRDAVKQLAAEAGLSDAAGDVASMSVAPPPPRVVGAGRDAEDDRRRNAALRVFIAAQPRLAGTPADAYLKGRGIDLSPLARAPRSLRFHPELWHHEARRAFPALVAGVTGADGRFAAVHRTWLQQDGPRWVKLRGWEAKLSLGLIAHGHIPIWRGASGRSLPDAPADEPVVIGEGIETCLSIALACPEMRVLCAISLGNLGRVALPPQVRSVILAADNDVKPAARRGLDRAVDEHMRAGREVRVARSPMGKDFNDALVAWA